VRNRGWAVAVWAGPTASARFALVRTTTSSSRRKPGPTAPVGTGLRRCDRRVGERAKRAMPPQRVKHCTGAVGAMSVIAWRARRIGSVFEHPFQRSIDHDPTGAVEERAQQGPRETGHRQPAQQFRGEVEHQRVDDEKE